MVNPRDIAVNSEEEEELHLTPSKQPSSQSEFRGDGGGKTAGASRVHSWVLSVGISPEDSCWGV